MNYPQVRVLNFEIYYYKFEGGYVFVIKIKVSWELEFTFKTTSYLGGEKSRFIFRNDNKVIIFNYFTKNLVISTMSQKFYI